MLLILIITKFLKFKKVSPVSCLSMSLQKILDFMFVVFSCVFYPVVLLPDCFTVFYICMSLWLYCLDICHYVLLCVSITLECYWLCSRPRWSTSYYHLSVFDCLISHSEIVFCWYGVTVTCLFVPIIGSAVLVLFPCNFFNCDLLLHARLWFPVSMIHHLPSGLLQLIL